jgi:hypothetical protein
MSVAAEERNPRVHNRGEHGKFSPDKLIDAMRGDGPDDKMTADDLSRATGISVEAIARWMAGLAAPRHGYAQSTAAALGVSVEDLYE